MGYNIYNLGAINNHQTRIYVFLQIFVQRIGLYIIMFYCSRLQVSVLSDVGRAKNNLPYQDLLNATVLTIKSYRHSYCNKYYSQIAPRLVPFPRTLEEPTTATDNIILLLFLCYLPERGVS